MRADGITVVGLSAGYGGVAVVRDIELEVGPGEVVALLGANGAGKTTTLLTISGLIEPLAGSISINGVEVDHRAPHRNARLGLAHVPEDRSLFFQLTVEENLKLGLPGRGAHAGAISYTYQQGPDGRRYAVGGEVPIDVSSVPGDPQATVRKMQQIRRTATAPAEPSAADRAVAAAATKALLEAQAQIASERAAAISGENEADEAAPRDASNIFSRSISKDAMGQARRTSEDPYDRTTAAPVTT